MSALDIWGPLTRARADSASTADTLAVTGRFATGVVVITVGSGSWARGMTVSAFSVAAKRPPLVSVAIRASSSCLAQVREEGRFAVSALAAGQGALARHFADPARADGLRQLSPDQWLIGPAGSIPVLRGAVGWLDCQTELAVPAGDHELIIARVRAAVPGRGAPLVQCDGALRDDLATQSPDQEVPAAAAAGPAQTRQRGQQ